jgi:hypothetical protein
MDPAQLAHEACKRFEALHTSGSNRTVLELRQARESREPGQPAEFGEQQSDEPLLEVFDDLGKLDGWAKIAMDQMVGHPQDGRAAAAAQELCRSLEQTARLHPYFARRLADVLTDAPS